MNDLNFVEGNKQSKYLIALSGGVDSIVTAHLLKSQLSTSGNHRSLRAIHINHGISQLAPEWANFCQKFCNEIGIELITERVVFDKSKNLEANARKARYAAIKNHIQEDETLVTGHHIDDQIETLLLALKRGSGLDGLSCMKQIGTANKLNVFRPLLNYSKDEILSYASRHQLEWVEDESNMDIAIERNFIRHKIVPLINSRWPSFSKTANRSINHCQNAKTLLNDLLKPEVKKATELGYLLRSEMTNKDVNVVYHIIRQWLSDNQIPCQSSARIAEIVKSVIFSQVDAKPKFHLTKNVVLRRVGDTIFIDRVEDATKNVC